MGEDHDAFIPAAFLLVEQSLEGVRAVFVQVLERIRVDGGAAVHAGQHHPAALRQAGRRCDERTLDNERPFILGGPVGDLVPEAARLHADRPPAVVFAARRR